MMRDIMFGCLGLSPQPLGCFQVIQQRGLKTSLHAAIRSVYVLKKTLNAVIYSGHRPTFQAQSWRAAFFCVSNLEKAPDVLIYSMCKHQEVPNVVVRNICNF